ncbi:hypothetical protein BKI52_04020 [marine bacterium AO1-C]|nr:hypothetical protein BKI52_04020 [marine bacterium AO1-C]
MCLTFQTSAQTPFLTHYSPDAYKAGIINWQGIQEKSGMLYFANMDGVLQFDGFKWQMHYLPQKEAVFSIALHNNGRIYVGGARQFGFMERNSAGNLQFQSLKKQLSKDAQSKLKTIYKIFILKNTVIFQGLKISFIYQNDSLHVLNIPSSDMFFLGDKLLVRKEQQLFEYSYPDKFTANNLFKGVPINSLISITPLTPSSFLIFNSQKQFSIYDAEAASGKRLKFIPTLDSVKNAIIQTIYPMSDGRLAISTYDQGLFVFNKEMQLLYKLDKTNGLRSNRVYAIFEDQQHNLWLPLYYGLAQVALGSPILQLNNQQFSGGFITSINKFKNTIYVGTTKGLFYRNAPQSKFKLVKNTPNENWNVYVFDNKVYLAHRTGVFLIQEGVAQKLAGFRFVHSLSKLKSPKNTFIVGTYDTGIWLLQQKNDRWTKTKIKGFEKETRLIQEDSNGDIWIAHYNEGIYKLTLNTRKDSVFKLRLYNKNEGLPSNKNNRIYRLKTGKIIATTTKGFYHYDPSSDKFVPYTKFNKPLKNQFCIYTFSEDSFGNIYFWAGQQALNQETAGILKKQSDGTYQLSNRIFNKIAQTTQGLRVDVDAPILVDNDQVFFGNVNNLKIYNSLQPDNIDTDYQTIINKITLKDSIIYSYGAANTQTLLPYELRDIKFSFAAMSFENIEQNKYSYQLKGYDDEWSRWQVTPTTIFTSLPEGNYVFKVKSKNIYNKESKVATFEFRILPPWYRTWWAYTLYVLFSIVLITIVARANSWRLKQQKKALEITVQERTEEIRAQNEELQQSQEEILAQRNFIEDQNKSLTEKNSQIQQSIKAALVIQKAILPFDSLMQKIFTEHFIMYKPKDVVSGDFYWIEQVNNHTIIVVADCTGHGVPGAFMSLIGYNLLDKIILLQKCLNPAEILQHLHIQITKLLKQDQFKNNSGLDAAIVILDKKEDHTNITFAGARRPLFYQSSTNPAQIHEVKGTRRSIGGYQNLNVRFQNHQIQLPQQKTIYLGTDGLEDQNNIHRKKFSKKRLIELFNDNAHIPLELQKKALEKQLQKHMQDTTQRDDILWMGIKP